MTNKEAIEILEDYYSGYFGYKIDDIHEAHNLAIKALEERPHGEWIKHIDNLYPEDSTEECPFCHEEQRLVGNDDNFCPNCGADMRGEDNE